MKALRPVIVILTVAVLLLASCAPGPNTLRGTQDEEGKVAGFWKGLWHGIITPVTFVVSLFNKGVNVYESRNSGGWYNFGYILGLSIVFGGGGRGSGGVRRRCREG